MNDVNGSWTAANLRPQSVEPPVDSQEVVCFTGKLDLMSRERAAELAEEMGMATVDSITKKTTLLVAGHNAGSKQEKAGKFGIRVISEAEWVSMVLDHDIDIAKPSGEDWGLRSAIKFEVLEPLALDANMSRVGGVPDLPIGMPWPAGPNNGTPLRYIARIDLAEVPNCDQRTLLPKDGVLHFFAAGEWEWAPAQGGPSDWSAPDDIADAGHAIIYVPAGTPTSFLDTPDVLMTWHRELNGRSGSLAAGRLSFTIVTRDDGDEGDGILLSNGMLGWQHAWQQTPEELIEVSPGDPAVQLGSFEDDHGGAWFFTIRRSDLQAFNLAAAESSYDTD